METTDVNQETVIAAEPATKKRGRPSGRLAKAAREAKEAARIEEEEMAPEVPSIAEVVRANIREDRDDRPSMRPAMREEDPRTRAARRTAELLDHFGADETTYDDFYIPASDVPDGWEYQWKRKSLLGMEDPAYMVELYNRGWEPVPASRHPSYMPLGHTGKTIERKGMILMERPLEISRMYQQRALQAARNQVRQKEAQLSGAPDGHFDRNNKNSSLVNVKKSYEAMPIPKE